MSKAHFDPTKFENVRTGVVSYGARIWDGYGRTYTCLLDSIPDDDLEFLEIIMEDNTDAMSCVILDTMQENEQGCFVGEVWYDWCDVEHLFEYRDFTPVQMVNGAIKLS